MIETKIGTAIGSRLSVQTRTECDARTSRRRIVRMVLRIEERGVHEIPVVA